MSREPRSGKGKPSAIGEALSELLQSRGLDAEVARAWVVEEWARIVGSSIAGVTTPRLVTDDGTLIVGVKTHGWMSELSLMERTLVAQINAEAGRTPVRRIRWELLREAGV